MNLEHQELFRLWLPKIVLFNDLERALDLSRFLQRHGDLMGSLRVLLPITGPMGLYLFTTVGDTTSRANCYDTLSGAVAECIRLFDLPGSIPLKIYAFPREAGQNFLYRFRSVIVVEGLAEGIPPRPGAEVIWTHPSWDIKCHGDDPWKALVRTIPSDDEGEEDDE